MTKRKLENRIAKLLNVTSSEKSIAVLFFKQKLAEHLSIGEALKIKDLGVFQLKEQLATEKKTKNKKPSSGKTVLIFSPESKGSETESLFLTLEIEPSKKNSTEFDEKVFNIGIGKPTVPMGENKDVGNDAKSELSIDEKITELISSSEKLESFDLWDDYLDGQQATANILDEPEEEIGDLDEYLQDEDTTPKASDFVELDEDELLAEFEDSELFNNEELEVEEITDESKLEVTFEEDIFDETTNEILEEVPIETEDIISDVDDLSDGLNIEEKVSSEQSVFYEQDEGKNDSSVEQTHDEIEEDVNESEEDVKPEITNEFKNENLEENMAHPGMKNFKNGPSTTIVGLIVAFFIVGAIGIYYLFFDNPTWLYDSNEVEIALSEKHAKEFEEAKRKALLVKPKGNTNDEKLVDEPTNEKEKVDDKLAANTNEITTEISEKGKDAKSIEKEIIDKVKKSDVKKSVEVPKVTKPKETKIIKKESQPKKTITVNKNVKKVQENIFFDGTNYSVQISSWRKKSIADKEVKRLIRKGHSAFIVKAYIPKYKANYYRVRIGEITSLDKAKTIQKTVK